MTQPRRMKSYLMPEGNVLFVDPDLSHLPLIHSFMPGFRVRSVPPPTGRVPRLLKTRATPTGLSREGLPETEGDILWEAHAKGVSGKLKPTKKGSATLLDVKIEMARRAFLSCTLCGHSCAVNRFLKPGKCGLRDKAYVAETFVHIAEEEVLTPAATVKLFQCALNCAGCQSHEVIHKREEEMVSRGRVLDGTVWQRCPDFARAATIEFVGGNPTESLYPVLKCLREMPEHLSRKPIVWNDHGYSAVDAYELLDGIVDVYLPDFKGADRCVEQISRVKGYWEYVTKGIVRMICQKAGVIVRVLVLPGHIECCHKPSLEWLAQYAGQLWVSLIEFIPDYRAFKDPALNRRTGKEEMAEARELVKKLGLRDVDEQPEGFWKAG